MKKQLVSLVLILSIIFVSSNINVFAETGEIEQTIVEETTSGETSLVDQKELVENEAQSEFKFSLPIVKESLYVYDIRRLEKELSNELEIVLSYHAGEKVDFLIEPLEEYTVEQIEIYDIDGNEIQYEEINSYHYTFTMPYADIVLRCSYIKATSDDGMLFSNEKVMETNLDKTFSGIDEAAEYLREQMVKRVENIKFSVNNSTNITANEMISAVRDKALEETDVSYEGDYLYYHVASESSSIIENEDNYDLTFSFTYRTTCEQEQEVTTAVKNIIDELKITGDTPDYVKIKKVYDYICQNVTYDYENLYDASYELKYTAYAAVVNNKAVCQGIALLMYRLLENLGIDSRLITGTSMNQNHMWNIVDLKGKYYNLDATWDLGLLEYNYFLKSDGTFDSDHYRDERCGSDEFKAVYPMADADYVVVDDDMGETYRFEYENIVYDVWEGEATVVGYAGEPVDVIIPEEVDEAKVVAISNNAFFQCKSIKSVVIPKTVIRIEDKKLSVDSGAFAKCDGLERVEFLAESGLKRIGAYAFYSCHKLNEIILPSTLEIIAMDAFSNCTSLKTLLLPDSLSELGQNALAGTSLKTIHLPINTINVGLGALSIDSLEAITVSENNPIYFAQDGVLYYGARECADLVIYPKGKLDKRFVMPDFVWRTRWDGFLSDNLETLVIGANCYDIYVPARIGCKRYEVNPHNSLYEAINGNLYSADGKKLLAIRKDIEGVIEIPSGVEVIGEYAGSLGTFSELILPDTVSIIEQHAFAENEYLKKVFMPKTIETIGVYAFGDCTALEKIDLPMGLEVVSIRTFKGCSSLNDITIPDSVEEIEYMAFNGCPCKIVRFPDHDVAIDAEAFSVNIFDEKIGFILKGTTVVKYIGIGGNVVIPDGITAISGHAFSYNSKVTSIVLSDTVERIGAAAFSGCSNLEYVYIPENVVEMGGERAGEVFGGPFSNCPLLISAGEAGGGYNIEFDWKNKMPDYAFMGSLIEVVNIPNEIKYIGKGAFESCKFLQNVNFAQGIQNVDARAFSNTPWYEKNTSEYSILGTVLIKYNGEGGDVIVPEGVTEIADKAFYGYSTINNVVLPDSVVKIGESAFEQCSMMASISLSENIVELGERAFAYCSSMTSLEIPEGVIEIPESTFDCSGLKDITFSSNIKRIGKGAFNFVPLESLLLPDGLEEIGDYAFRSLNITDLVIPGSVERVGEQAFAKNSKLEKLVVEEGVQEFGSLAFEDCSQLESVSLPTSMTNVAASVFKECTLLVSAGPISSNKTIEFGWTEYIPSNAFLGCNYLEEVVLPENCAVIGARAFYSCTSLENIEFNDKLHEIGQFAFGRCFTLTAVELPISLLKIGTNIFKDAESLNVVSYEGAIEDWEEIKVDDCNNWFGKVVFSIVHLWKQVLEQIPTCTEEGKQQYRCENCNKEKVVSLKATGHKYNEWIVEAEATCIKAGSKHRTCTNEGCDSVETKEIPVTSHSSITILINAKSATCTEEGYTGDEICTTCGEMVKVGQIIQPVGHMMGDWIAIESPSCEADGSEQQTCSVCKYKETKKLNRRGHTWETGYTVDKQATCEIDGSESIHCKKCEAIKDSRSIPATGHAWDNGTIITSSTNIAPGERRFTCSKCGNQKSELIPKLKFTTGTSVSDTNNLHTYKVLSNNTVAFTKTNSRGNTIVVPKTLNVDGVTYKVTSIAPNAFKNNKKVTKVVIGNNVKTIGKNAFYGCKKLKSVTIGKNATTIGDNAFYKCIALTKLTIPSKVKKLGKQAFCGCKKLKSITIKTTKLTSKNVGKQAFKGTYTKATIKVPKKKLSVYKKLLKSKGISKKAKIKK